MLGELKPKGPKREASQRAFSLQSSAPLVASVVWMPGRGAPTPSRLHCLAACKAWGRLPPEPQRHKHRAPHMTRALEFDGFGELRRMAPSRLSHGDPGAAGVCRGEPPVEQWHVGLKVRRCRVEVGRLVDLGRWRHVVGRQVASCLASKSLGEQRAQNFCSRTL